MFDVTLIPHRNPLQTAIFMEYKPQGVYVQDWGIIPQQGVDMQTETFADLTYTSTAWSGDWTWGAEIPTMFQNVGGQRTFTTSMWARGISINVDKLNEKLPAPFAVKVKNDATFALKRTMKTLLEKKYIALLTNTANYAAGFYDTPTKKWDASDSTVQKDIVTVLQKMEAIDLPVTHVIIPQKVMTALTLNSAFITALNTASVPQFIVDKTVIQKFTGLTPDQIYCPQVFDYGRPRVIDMSAANAAFANTAQLWTDDVIFLHIEDAGMGTYPSLVNLNYMEPSVQQLPFDAETLDTKFIARQAKTPVFFNNNAAFLLHDVLA